MPKERHTVLAPVRVDGNTKDHSNHDAHKGKANLPLIEAMVVLEASIQVNALASIMREGE